MDTLLRLLRIINPTGHDIREGLNVMLNIGHMKYEFPAKIFEVIEIRILPLPGKNLGAKASKFNIRIGRCRCHDSKPCVA